MKNRPSCLPSRNKNGFTLVELLVVISIISLLMAVLLPVLGKARKSAVGLKCMNNVRQVNMGFYQYQLDFRDRIVGYTIPKLQSSHVDIYWFTVMLNRNYLVSNDKAGTMVYSNVSASVVKDSQPPMRCVDETDTTRYSTQNVRKMNSEDSPATPTYLHGSSNASRFLVSYTMNANLGSTNSQKRLSQATRGSSDILYFTCGYKGGTLSTAAHWQARNMFQHNGATSTAFLDGHVAALNERAVTSDDQLAF